MIGVVLWCDETERKAVFWCEDHGDLAYFDATHDTAEENCEFSAGDMLEFDVSLEHRVRRASNARLIQQRVCTGLQAQVRRSGQKAIPQPANSDQGDVLPFRRRSS